jgi:arylsulfatase A-like enzyme
VRGAIVALFALAACHAEPKGPARATNLILISIDTLRADRLGCYGAARATSPALDAFAARSVRFERAYAAAPWTLPSHVTMLSGLLPETHGVDQPDLRPGAGTRLLAEVLRAAGYYTFANTDGGWLGADYGLDRGFLAFQDGDRELAATLADVRERIDAVHGERPFFAFVHTYDVHCPYTPGPPYDALFASADAEPIETAGRCGNPDYNALDVSAAQARFLADRYDGGIRRADDALGPFLAFLEERGVLRDTVVVLTSDHGEEFLDHGRIGHEESVYPELLHVPLLVYVPGGAARACAEPVGLVDLAPTLVELLGLAALDDVDGRSLVPLLDGAELAPRALHAELAWKRRLEAWIDGTTQIVSSADGLERYDLARDPLARANLADGATAAELALLRARVRSGRPRVPLAALPGPDTRRALEAFGYAGR